MKTILKFFIGLARRLYNNNPKLKKEHTKAVIIGNGPSLKNDITYLYDLKLVDFWCVNGFVLDDNYLKLRPNHYILADHAFWLQDNYEKLNIFVDNVLSSLNSKTTWPLTIHIPLLARGAKSLEKLSNPLISVRFFNNTYVELGFDWLQNWAYKHEICMPIPQNVLVPAIYLAILAGYNDIYLLGADHDWHKNLNVINSQLLIQDMHFYDNQEQIEYRPFLKNDGQPWRVFEIFSAWSTVHLQYFKLNKLAIYMHRCIINLSSNTFIDSFTTQKISEIHFD